MFEQKFLSYTQLLLTSLTKGQHMLLHKFMYFMTKGNLKTMTSDSIEF